MDDFGDRMKFFEGMEANRYFLPYLPVMARIDGRCFSSFTDGMQRPFDARMSLAMVNTTKRLVKETDARCGYVQSDEISLVWWEPDYKTQIFFGGRIQKIVSVVASMATVYFNNEVRNLLPEFVDRFPVFDCRVWQVPNLTEAANTFLWREKDATKNSISMAASHYYKHGELNNKDSSEKQEMLFQKGINWNNYPSYFKRGVFVQRREVKEKFNPEDLEKLPPKHQARLNPDLVISRNEVISLDMPPFGKVKNREDVIFNKVDPVVEEE